jgi:hypothetical protein
MPDHPDGVLTFIGRSRPTAPRAHQRNSGARGQGPLIRVLWIVAALAASIVFGLASPAGAQLKGGTAEIRSLNGQVEVQRKGQAEWVAAVAGMRLVDGDEIRAHAGASAVLDLADGSTLFVAENSRVVVTKLAVDPRNNARQALFHLVVGKVRALVTHAAITLVRARQSNFAISTPTAVAAVRGTLYEVSYDPARTVMTVAVLPGQPGTGGLVTCTAYFDRFAPVSVPEGFVSFASGSAGCAPAVTLESLPPAERAYIGTLSNPVPPGPTFSGPVTIPTPAEVFGVTSGPAPPLPSFFTSAPTGQNPTAGPSSVGVDAAQQQPPTSQ